MCDGHGKKPCCFIEPLTNVSEQCAWVQVHPRARVTRENWLKNLFAGGAGEGSVETSTEFLRKKLEVSAGERGRLELEIAEAERLLASEEAEWGPQKKTLQSEFAMLQERTREESRDAELTARFSVVKEIVPVLDNFARASAKIKPVGTEQEKIVAYYKGVFATIDAVLASLDVEAVPTLGAPFDFTMHKAIQSEPSDDFAEDLVCKEFQAGWKIKDRVIQPAMVAVSLGPGP
jgi:molecular chaperone GrpE